MVRINLNESVKVKLSDKGKDIFYHQYDDLLEAFPDIKPHYPEEDEDGYTTMQLAEFMRLYGPHIPSIGYQDIIHPFEIVYEDEFAWGRT